MYVYLYISIYPCLSIYMSIFLATINLCMSLYAYLKHSPAQTNLYKCFKLIGQLYHYLFPGL